MTRILFVCLGNICRSPTAEWVTRVRAARKGVTVEVASCGTGNWHVGQGADPRTVRHALERGYDLSRHRARTLHGSDFSNYDRLLAMDAANLRELQRRAPPEHAHKLGLFLEEGAMVARREVPDPYSGGPEGFEEVLDLVEQAADGLLGRLARNLDVA